MEDIGAEEGYSWLGHIYNLQGYIYFQLGFTDDARLFFSKCAEAFRQIRNAISDEGPWLLVNYGNQAWLHHLLGEQTKSQDYLSKVDALVNNYPSMSPHELHPEIYAEKAWTLMHFGKMLPAGDCFQRAIRMQPDIVEWHTSCAIASAIASKRQDKVLEENILEKMRVAKQHDPENLYLAAVYLDACAKKGERIKDEVHLLGRKVLIKPASRYSGIKPILRLYRMHVSMDEAIDLAEEALGRHPDNRYLKECAAICYSHKVIWDRDYPMDPGRISRAINLCNEVIALYPHSSFKRKLTLAKLYADLDRKDEAEQIYKELLESELDPEGFQMCYNHYALYANYVLKDSYKSIEYHMKAAEIPNKSTYRENSLQILKKIKERNRNRMCGEIETFLMRLHDYEY